MKNTNVIIIGSGIAALKLAKSLRCDMNVIILTKSYLNNSNSYLAQGGVAVAIGKSDHPEKHYLDTLEAGRFHNDPEAVLALTHEAPSLINGLLNEGCMFDKDQNGELLLGLEGAHSENRIVHGGGDATGRTLIQFMTSQINTNIEIIENIFVYELLLDESGNRCVGVKGKDLDSKTETFFADHIVIASGGCGQLYSYTSNAEPVTGDGIALAYLAGAEITDMEFIQFHPTLLYANGKAAGLVSEAVRGEGGRLVTEDGKPIMAGVHPLGDLAPRHIVSQSIYSYLKKGIQIFLDISAVVNFQGKFPTVTALCEQRGIDVKKGMIPVVPGSHFLMGGIKTDLIGKSSVKGLYAIGEAACTGVHGANRLASNSLLEGLFFGKKLAEWINTQPISDPFGRVFSERFEAELTMENSKSQIADCPITDLSYQTLQFCFDQLPSAHAIQTSMMDHAGIFRTKEGLIQQKEWLESFSMKNWLDVRLDHLTIKEMSRVFMLMTAWLITDSALKRTESRGGHFRQDYPCENNHFWLRKQIVQCRKKEKDGKHEQIETALAT
ncbi:L-aspartate oxidase [Bacillus sp. FJAT-29790]|uniref:L-aspartate oxidase n=1 Tax=Bacillus sp. FJAT-29790 TaxID=1895002 RepID=UPI001C2202BF|nr:L-aspartate oxidase [Bacillus sp. FJAT-29790]MBU8879540.1 L-aspartate oxidase [Bacillus sp. FJAT-29790]